MTELETLTGADVGWVQRVCARSMPDPPTDVDLRSSLFTPELPVTVRGVPDRAVVATCVRDGQSYLRLLAVDPDARGHGLGRRLLEAAEADLAGTITVGSDAPDYLFPGVETTQVEMLCLLEAHRYERGEANLNMTVDLEHLPAVPDDPPARIAGTADRVEVDRWCAQHWAHWRAEVLRCLDRGTLAVARDDGGIVAVCCWDGARIGWVGPVAVRPDLLGQGRGRSVLAAALGRLRDDGRRRADIGWVGPIRPYARTVGATVHRVFYVYRKRR